MVLDYNNNVPNNKEFSMAQINQKPKTGIYKLQDDRIVKVLEWFESDDEDGSFIAVIQPDWGDGPYLTFDYDGKDNCFFGDQGGFFQNDDGSLEAFESMTETTLIEFVE